MSQAISLENQFVRWDIACDANVPRAVSLLNKRTGNAFILQEACELTLVLSAVPDRVQEPLARVSDFALLGVVEADDAGWVLSLHSPSSGIRATVHYALDGPTRRKWAEVSNATDDDLLVLDVDLDAFRAGAPLSGGGQGWPVFIADEAFAAVECPAGESRVEGDLLTLAHFPGRRLAPGETFTSHAALVSVADASQAASHFVQYISERSVRRDEVLSIVTPFGINNQWGPCPTLDDEETLHFLDLLEKLKDKGAGFDYFTLDTGWVDPGSDLTRFRPNAYPSGPEAVVNRVRELGMEFGLWFASSWGAESCWDAPDAWPGDAPEMAYMNGCPAKAQFGGLLCLGYEPYAKMLREAILHHIRENHVRFVKLDGGHYQCDDPDHGHLPGKYSTERMYDTLVEIARAAREEAPDVFVMWYWGLRSPFWALHGDTIFESGLHMEGSGTSSTPTLYYRDSVTLAQDQNAHNAALVPPLCKDSLGVWLADTRWGNFMGKERWREALVMDLARGSLLFPNLWGDLYLLDDEDAKFLAWISALARDNEGLFLQRRIILGDPFRAEPYGYSHCRGGRGFVFISNPGFEPRQVALPLDGSLGLDTPPGAPLQVVSHFPEAAALTCADGELPRMGEPLDLWLRPFEVLMLEVSPPAHVGEPLSARSTSADEYAGLGQRLFLEASPVEAVRAAQFVDAERFELAGHVGKRRAFEATLPPLDGLQPILAVSVRLRRGEEEFRHTPFVTEIVQVRAWVGDQSIQLMPVPEARQFGNTQHAGCSWVVYKTRLPQSWSGQSLRMALDAWLPEDVEARLECWLVRRWWQEDHRPSPDGYYGQAPS